MFSDPQSLLGSSIASYTLIWVLGEGGAGVGFLQGGAPIAELLQRDLLAGHGAEDIAAGFQHGEIAVAVVQLGEVLAGKRLSDFTADSPEIIRFWGPAGHYWTVYLVSLAAGWSRHAALTNAFYAQMPDQVDELDATEAGEDYVKTYAEKLFTPKVASETFNREVSRLETDKIVQRGLHALTRRNGKDETDLRQAIFKRLKPGTFEFALALHPFGDSFAHRMADTDSCLMYNAPFGHAVEIAHFKDPHSPDNLHLHRQLYVRYGLKMFDLLANSLTDNHTKEKKAKLEAQLDEVAKEVDDEHQISKIIAITGSHSGYRPEKEKLLQWKKFHSNHRHLAMSLVDQALRCARAWST